MSCSLDPTTNSGIFIARILIFKGKYLPGVFVMLAWKTEKFIKAQDATKKLDNKVEIALRSPIKIQPKEMKKIKMQPFKGSLLGPQPSPNVEIPGNNLSGERLINFTTIKQFIFPFQSVAEDYGMTLGLGMNLG